MAHKTMKEPSDSTKLSVEGFIKARDAYVKAYGEFCDKHQREIDDLDKLREEHNIKLNEAVKSLKEEAFEISILEYSGVHYGPLQIIKKWSNFYRAEEFTELMKEKGLYDAAVAEGAIAEKIEVDYRMARSFLEKNNLITEFEKCEDGKELSPSLAPGSPKPIAGFGAKGD